MITLEFRKMRWDVSNPEVPANSRTAPSSRLRGVGAARASCLSPTIEPCSVLVTLLGTLGLWSSSGRFHSVPLSLGGGLCSGDLKVIPGSKSQKGLCSFRVLSHLLPHRSPCPQGGKGSLGCGWIISRGGTRRPHSFLGPSALLSPHLVF